MARIKFAEPQDDFLAKSGSAERSCWYGVKTLPVFADAGQCRKG